MTTIVKTTKAPDHNIVPLPWGRGRRIDEHTAPRAEAVLCAEWRQPDPDHYDPAGPMTTDQWMRWKRENPKTEDRVRTSFGPWLMDDDQLEPSQQKRFSREHAAYWSSRGVPAFDLAVAGVATYPDRDALFEAARTITQGHPDRCSPNHWVNNRAWTDSMLIPRRGLSLDSQGRQDFNDYQIRPGRPDLVELDGKPAKILSPDEATFGGANIPRRTIELIRAAGGSKLTRPFTLFLTEGAGPAFAMAMAGLPTMASWGVDGWGEKGQSDSGEYIPDPESRDGIKRVLTGDVARLLNAWQENDCINLATVVIVYDSDCHTNPNVVAAGQRTMKLLKPYGVKVEFFASPRVENMPKAGADDFLSMPNASVDAFFHQAKLISQQRANVPAERLPGGPLWKPGMPKAGSEEFAVEGAPCTSWNEAVKTGGWTVVDADPVTQEVIIARADQWPGIWRLSVINVETADRRPVQFVDYTQLTKWVAWRSGVLRTLSGDAETEDPRYTVSVIGEGRRVDVVVDGEESLDITRLRKGVDSIGMKLPHTRQDVEAVIATLHSLGKDERETTQQWDSCGWAKVDGHWTFLAPAGSVTADGIRHDLTVIPPSGSEPEELTGWAQVPVMPADHRQGITAIVKLLTLAPRKPSWGVANVGALLTAPLALPRRVALVTWAQPQTGKSLASSCVYSAISSVGADGASMPLGITTSSEAGAELFLQWSRHMLAPCEDYRRRTDRGSASANARALGVLTVIAQKAYGASNDKKSTRTRELRSTRRSQSIPAITAEILASHEQAVVERCVTVGLMKGDIDLRKKSRDGVDGHLERWRSAYAETGVVRIGMAGYLQWLAGRLDSDWKSLQAMGARWEQVRQEGMGIYGTGRSGEGAAVLRTGWAAFREYAKSVGCEDVLPSAEWIDTVFQAIESETGQEHSAGDPGKIVLATIRQMLTGGHGHLYTNDGREPGRRKLGKDGRPVGLPDDALSIACGWERRGPGEDWTPRGPRIGRISEDGSHVLLSDTGLRTAAQVADMTGLDHRQISDAIARISVKQVKADGTPAEPGGRVTAEYGIGDRKSRPEGYLVTAEQVGLGAPEADLSGMPEAPPAA